MKNPLQIFKHYIEFIVPNVKGLVFRCTLDDNRRTAYVYLAKRRTAVSNMMPITYRTIRQVPDPEQLAYNVAKAVRANYLRNHPPEESAPGDRP